MSEVRLIDANALIQDLRSAKYLCYDNNSISRIGNHEIDRCISFVEDAPTITPDMAQVLAYESGEASADRPTGEWIRYRDNPHQPEHIKCSNCGQYWSIADHDKTFEYCFKCGARMEAENDSSK